MTAGATVLVIDDHELFAASLTYVLSDHGFDAHRIPITDLDTVRDAAQEHAPGVVLLDLDLGRSADGRRLDGVDLVIPLRTQGWSVLILTGTAELDHVAAAVAAGAAGWVVKGVELQELVAATAELAAGSGGLSEPERRAMLQRHRAAQREGRKGAQRLCTLTPTEREVLDRLTTGASAADIAQSGCTSIRTVRAHIRSILAKLDVNSQGAATAIARQHRAPAPPIPATVWRQLRGARGGQVC